MTWRRALRFLAGIIVLLGLAFIIFIGINLYQFREAPFVLDQVRVWDEQVISGEKYTLAQIITGFHEKTEEVALFKNEIKYDKWGNPIYNNIIFREYIDQQLDRRARRKRTAIKGYLEIHKKRIRVVFDNKNEEFFAIPLGSNATQVD